MASPLRAAFLGAIFAVAAVAVACGAESDSTSDSVSGDGAAEAAAFLDVTLSTTDGGQLDFGTLEGRDVVLWFWAPW